MSELLRIENLNAWYGESHILHGIDLSVARGEVVTLLGRNGAGRTTALKSILALVDKRTGSIRVNGTEIIKQPTHKIARLGMLGYCPEERGIFSRLNVEENLNLPPRLSDDGMSVSEIYEMFPNLAERRRSLGTQLSGGEQQMLAMARVLRTGAQLLLLDEITEGLAPVIVQALGNTIRQIKERGLTIVLVEQNFHFAAPLADRHYIIEHGEVAEVIEASQAKAKKERINQFLSV
ncbi:ABC transporter ATP-binding protein [Salinisphaera sp. T31B1]|uniref:ABC transporter ATP-binding protein n=1 Tax=Salinisphaera sp. T31B1 TaxID=727963 RepID=UPI003342556D